MTEVSVETCLTNSKVLSLSLNSYKLNIFHLIKKKKNDLRDANSRFKEEEEVREEAKYNGHDESTRSGLLPTCAGVLREIIPTRSFSRILANHTSEESLITADYDKNII